MRKLNLVFLAVLCLLAALSLAGCRSDADVPLPTLQTVPPTAAPTEAPTETQPPETEAHTEPPATEEAIVTEAPTQPPKAVPYLQKVTYADQSIYGGPGYDYGFVGTVREAGTYTIVEEARDVEDNLWGRLKSGAGWIDLTEVRRRLESPELISANYADDLLLKSGNYHHFVGDDSEYAVHIAFRAHETLTDFTLCSMELTETMEVAEQIFFLSQLEPGKPLVADLDFPGDMSTYAVFFTDSRGTARQYTVSISGRNGAIELIEQS